MKLPNSNYITDSIELVAPIAEGAMGNVWEAFHHRLKTRVAVKFVSDTLGENTPEALARFQREAAAASQIKSIHVVRTFDSGISLQGAPYMVMELLDGENLAQRLHRSTALSLQEIAVLLNQVGRALDNAHQQGIIHRDIKPANIFLCATEEEASSEPFFFCKVLDFGIAKQTQLPQMGGLTTEGKIVGTPEFMSPEQVLEEGQVDRRADLWGLAVVCYVALTQQLPFQGRTLGQLCLELANPQPPKASLLRPELSSQVDQWFARCFHKDSTHRFSSAKEMSKAFAAVLEGALAPDHGTPLALESTPTPPVRSKRSAVLALSAAAALLLLFLFARSGPFSDDDPKPRPASALNKTSENDSANSTASDREADPKSMASASNSTAPSLSAQATAPSSSAAPPKPQAQPQRRPARKPQRKPTKPTPKKDDPRSEKAVGF